MKIKQVLKRVWRYLLKGVPNIDVCVDVAMIDRGQCLKDKKLNFISEGILRYI